MAIDRLIGTKRKTSRARGATAPPLRILVADDHDIIRRGVKQLLEEGFGAVVIGEAKDAQETLDLVQHQDWDVVLLDITMPGRSGLEVLAEMKAVCPQLPILMLSAFPEEEFAMRALKTGAAGYINKRTVSDEVITAINKVRDGGRYVSPALAEKMAFMLGGRAERPAHELLSNREFQVMRLIAMGRTIKEIAAELSLSEKTVGTYRTRISEKMRLGTNVEITRYALQHGLVT